MSRAAKTFVYAHLQLRLREMPLVGAAFVLLAILAVILGFGLQLPERFSPAAGGRSAGLAGFLAAVYHPWALLLAASFATLAALSGPSASRGSGLEESLLGTQSGESLRPFAELLATALVCLVFALVPLPLQLWAWRLGVVSPDAVLNAAWQLMVAGGCAALVVSVVRQLCSGFGARLQLALGLEWGLALVVFVL